MCTLRLSVAVDDQGLVERRTRRGRLLFVPNAARVHDEHDEQARLVDDKQREDDQQARLDRQPGVLVDREQVARDGEREREEEEATSTSRCVIS